MFGYNYKFLILLVFFLQTNNVAAAASDSDEQLQDLIQAIKVGTKRANKSKENLKTVVTKKQSILKNKAAALKSHYIADALPELVDIIDPWSAAYEATRPSNPMVSPTCRREAFAKAAKHHKETTGHSVEKHFLEQRKKFATGSLAAADYFEHLVECENFCARLVGMLLSCHIDALARLPQKDTVLVLFGRSKDELSSAVDKKLKQFAKRIRHTGHKVLLYGSSSRLTRNDTHSINEELSKSRAESVRRALIEYGIDENSIFMTWINQEPPRMSSKIIAKRLGYIKVWRKLKQRKRLKYIDQNVMVVAWRTENNHHHQH